MLGKNKGNVALEIVFKLTLKVSFWICITSPEAIFDFLTYYIFKNIMISSLIDAVTTVKPVPKLCGKKNEIILEYTIYI